MGSIGETRSKETGNHVKRVAEYSRILAQGLELDEAEVEMIVQASPMHDIGKVAIADSILHKPGRLSEGEFIIMKEHAQLGYEMLKSSQRPLMKLAATIALEHHEWWDGSGGYPQNRKGEEISIAARITAVADVFDALGSDRVYKEAWEDEAIFALLKEERGRQFDPTLIDLFFAHLDEILSIRDRFKDV
jgi:putative two-component system response regulator